MLTTQLLSALVLLLLGFAFGLIFDLYRVLRVLSKPGRFVTAICDLLFWVAYTVWVFATLIRFNSGEVRYYVFLSLGLGATVYFIWFSRSMVRGWYTLLCALAAGLAWLTEIINRVLDVVIAIIVWPYRILNNYLVVPCYRIIKFLLTPAILSFRFVGRVIRRFAAFLIRPLHILWSRLRRYLASLLEIPPEPPSLQ